LVELFSQFGQSRVAAHDDKAKLAKSLQTKEEIAQKRKDSAVEVERRAAQHFQEIVGTYEKDRQRRLDLAAKIPTGSEVARLNQLAIDMNMLSIAGDLAIAYYGRSPAPLEDAWNTMQHMFEDNDLPADPATPRPKHYTRRGQAKPDVSVRVQPIASSLAMIVTQGPKNGVDWEKVQTEVPNLRATFGLELDLLKLESEEDDDGLDKPTLPLEKSTSGGGSGEARRSLPETHAETQPPHDEHTRVKDLLEEGQKLCDELVTLQLVKDKSKVSKVTEKILDFNFRVTSFAAFIMLESHNALPIMPSSEDNENDKPKGRGHHGPGDMARKTAEFNFKIAEARLNATRELYLASVDDSVDAVHNLAGLVEYLAKVDVKKWQANEVMSMMGKQLALMGDVEMAFTSIKCLFSVIDNTVKVTMKSALEDLKQKVEMRLKNGIPTKEFVLNENAKRAITDQVIKTARVAKMAQDLATMYTTMFHESVEEGLEIVLGMQELVVLTSVDIAEINRERGSLRAWAVRAQSKMAEILKKDNEDFLAEIESSMKAVTGAMLHVQVSPEVEKAVQDGKKRHLRSAMGVLSGPAKRRQVALKFPNEK